MNLPNFFERLYDFFTDSEAIIIFVKRSHPAGEAVYTVFHISRGAAGDFTPSVSNILPRRALYMCIP